MKIQLKRSNVLEGGVAKAPTSGQMEYGELAVNYNTQDPALFIKDSADAIIRISKADITVGDGLAEIEAGGTTTLSVVADPGYAIDVTATGLRFGNSWVNIPNLPG